MESAVTSTTAVQEQKNNTSDNEAFVPVLSQLTDAYHDTNGNIKGKHIPRFRNLTNRFKQLYGVEPAFFCRAPGRVNIIGEHIDYCGYSVLPAAIE
jgi:galactokinase